MKSRVQSSCLFAAPSFSSGVARVIDLWGQFDDYNLSDSNLQADGKAIASDWIVVGDDIMSAVEHYNHEFETQLAGE